MYFKKLESEFLTWFFLIITPTDFTFWGLVKKTSIQSPQTRPVVSLTTSSGVTLKKCLLLYLRLAEGVWSWPLGRNHLCVTSGRNISLIDTLISSTNDLSGETDVCFNTWMWLQSDISPSLTNTNFLFHLPHQAAVTLFSTSVSCTNLPSRSRHSSFSTLSVLRLVIWWSFAVVCKSRLLADNMYNLILQSAGWRGRGWSAIKQNNRLSAAL